MFYSEYTYKLFSAFVERTAVGAGAAPVVLAGALELHAVEDLVRHDAGAEGQRTEGEEPAIFAGFGNY